MATSVENRPLYIPSPDPSSPGTPAPVANRRWVVAAKVAVAALAVIAALGAACALGYIAIPMFSLGALGIFAGTVAMCGAVGVGVGGAILAPIRAAHKRNDHLLLNTTLKAETDHNVKDCIAHGINTVALSLLSGLTLTILPAAALGFTFTAAVASRQTGHA